MILGVIFNKIRFRLKNLEKTFCLYRNFVSHINFYYENLFFYCLKSGTNFATPCRLKILVIIRAYISAGQTSVCFLFAVDVKKEMNKSQLVYSAERENRVSSTLLWPYSVHVIGFWNDAKGADTLADTAYGRGCQPGHRAAIYAVPDGTHQRRVPANVWIALNTILDTVLGGCWFQCKSINLFIWNTGTRCLWEHVILLLLWFGTTFCKYYSNDTTPLDFSYLYIYQNCSIYVLIIFTVINSQVWCQHNQKISLFLMWQSYNCNFTFYCSYFEMESIECAVTFYSGITMPS